MLAALVCNSLLYYILVKNELLPIQAAYAIGYASGTLLTFYLNTKFNFKTNDQISLRLFSFSSVAFIGWAISAVMLYLLVNKLGMNKISSLFPTVFVSVLLQYNLNRLISFRKAN